MFELIHEAFALFRVVEAWFLAQPLVLKVLIGAMALAVVWVLWVILRVFLVAVRAAFRGL